MARCAARVYNDEDSVERVDGLHPPDAVERAAARRGVETARGAAVDSLLDAATAFWRSATLLAACEIGLFDALLDSPTAVEQLAQRTSAPSILN
jgi:hypothetical protein